MLKTERMDRVRAALRAQGLTQMIVCDPKSVWYLTGVAVEPQTAYANTFRTGIDLIEIAPGDTAHTTIRYQVLQ